MLEITKDIIIRHCCQNSKNGEIINTMLEITKDIIIRHCCQNSKNGKIINTMLEITKDIIIRHCCQNSKNGKIINTMLEITKIAPLSERNIHFKSRLWESYPRIQNRNILCTSQQIYHRNALSGNATVIVSFPKQNIRLIMSTGRYVWINPLLDKHPLKKLSFYMRYSLWSHNYSETCL